MNLNQMLYLGERVYQASKSWREKLRDLGIVGIAFAAPVCLMLFYVICTKQSPLWAILGYLPLAVFIIFARMQMMDIPFILTSIARKIHGETYKNIHKSYFGSSFWESLCESLIYWLGILFVIGSFLLGIVHFLIWMLW